MFDVGFSELMVIAVVALVVIGPERLPRVARTLGHLFARLQRYVNEVKADINREIELDELRKFKDEFEQAARSMESHVKDEMNQAEASLAGIADQASIRPEIEKTQAELAALARDASGDPHAAPDTVSASEPGTATQAPLQAAKEPGSGPAAALDEAGKTGADK
jgi:sec-independent protein translocase protein TatB